MQIEITNVKMQLDKFLLIYDRQTNITVMFFFPPPLYFISISNKTFIFLCLLMNTHNFYCSLTDSMSSHHPFGISLKLYTQKKSRARGSLQTLTGI
jgi:hypothetical protein